MPSDDSQATLHPLIADILQRFDVDASFPAEVITETNYWLANPGTDDSKLVDYRDVPFVTMDNPGSKDLDQAFVIETQPAETQASTDDKEFRLRYAIADGSALFNEALKRGATVYTPQMAIPMLPPALSEGLVSLNPHVDRRALVFDCRFTPEGKLQTCELVRAVIHSQAKLTYGEVQEFLDSLSANSYPASISESSAFLSSLRLLKKLGLKLIEQAASRDVVALQRYSTRVVLHGKPAEFDLVRRNHYQTERYNEQLSLVCNQEGARLLAAWDDQLDHVQGVYRIHEAPYTKELKRLRQRLVDIQSALNLPKSFIWQKNQSLADYIAQLPTGLEFSKRVTAIHQQVMMTFRASRYTPEPGRHHALGADSYARFSSPMREIVGIYTHHELLEALQPDQPANINEALPEAIIDSANRSRQRQRQIEKRIEYEVLQRILNRDLANATRPVRPATIVGLSKTRIYVRTDNLLIDLKVYRQDLEKQYATTYLFSDVQAKPDISEKPIWSLGDGVNLTVAERDTQTGRFVLHLHTLT